MTPTWLNPSATEYSDIKVDNIKHHAITHTVTVAAVTIFAPQVPAQSKSTRTGNTDALSNHGMLAWCTWPLLGPILSPLSKNSTINIPAFLTPKSCSQVLALLLSIPSWKKVRRSWHGHDTNMTESECNWIQRHQSGQHQAPCCHTQSQSLLSQSLHHRSPHKANQPGRVIRMHYQTMECLHDALDHCLVQFFLHCLKIPRSTSLHSWHLNPAHKCLHCYCQFQAGKKVRRSWHGHDTNMTESECNWIQRHQSGQHQAPCYHTHSHSRCCHNLCTTGPHTKQINQDG